MIRHFKNHFLSILAGINAAFPPYLRDLLLPQAKPTVNLLCQATINPKISAWQYFNNGCFDFNKTPIPSGLQGAYPCQACNMQVMGLQCKARLLCWPCIRPLQVLRIGEIGDKSEGHLQHGGVQACLSPNSGSIGGGQNHKRILSDGRGITKCTPSNIQ